uniref:Uncharacterized protein n=1 Tax=Anguilla anguilla TaxID=7936 RepID=A0A0E9XQ83_ANGAN
MKSSCILLHLSLFSLIISPTYHLPSLYNYYFSQSGFSIRQLSFFS